MLLSLCFVTGGAKQCTPSWVQREIAIRSQQRVPYLNIAIVTQSIDDWNVLRVSKEGKGTIEPRLHCNCEGFRAIDSGSSSPIELFLEGQK